MRSLLLVTRVDGLLAVTAAAAPPPAADEHGALPPPHQDPPSEVYISDREGGTEGGIRERLCGNDSQFAESPIWGGGVRES